jgi:hypothetical protein
LSRTDNAPDECAYGTKSDGGGGNGDDNGRDRQGEHERTGHEGNEAGQQYKQKRDHFPRYRRRRSAFAGIYAPTDSLCFIRFRRF